MKYFLEKRAVKNCLLIALAITFPFSLIAQKKGKTAKNSPTKGIQYETDAASGIKYHFYRQNKTGKKAAMDNVVTLEIQWKNDKDSILFNSITAKQRRPGDTIGTIVILLKKSFNACLEQGITLMAEGDSAAFLVSADSLYMKTFKMQAIPSYIHAGTMLTFDVKLVKLQTQEELQQMQKDQMKKKEEEGRKRKDMEIPAIAKYLKDSNYSSVKPTPDSLFILKNKPGNGKTVEIGDSVYCLYVGKFLDGKIFDQSSIHGNGLMPLLFNGSASPVIRGWSIIIGGMTEGGKVTVLIPSKLAYGSYGAGNIIPPYTPLLFDIELAKVVKNGQPAAK